MKDLKWKTLSSEYLFGDVWFKARKDICETPEGTIVNPYYVFEFPTWVVALPVTEDGKIVMVRQYRQALGETCMEIPGGVVDDTDKDFEEAAARELREETGYAFSKLEYLGRISANPSTNSNLTHMFLATGGKKVGEQELDKNEEIEVHLFTVDEVKEMIRKNEIVQSLHITCFLYGFEKLGLMKL